MSEQTNEPRDSAANVLALAKASARVATGLADVAIAQVKTNAATIRATRTTPESVVHPTVLAANLIGLAEDIVSGTRRDPNWLLEIVRTEAERAVASVGLGTSAELEVARARISRLEDEVERLRSLVETSQPHASTQPEASVATKAPARKTAAKKTTAKKAPAKKSTAAKKTTAKKTTAKKSSPAKSTQPAKAADPTKAQPVKATQETLPTE